MCTIKATCMYVRRIHSYNHDLLGFTDFLEALGRMAEVRFAIDSFANPCTHNGMATSIHATTCIYTILRCQHAVSMDMAYHMAGPWSTAYCISGPRSKLYARPVQTPFGYRISSFTRCLVLVV